ncbi:MAG: hypothetical protein VB031_00820 [Eubacteriaceae bacterium]|nr:hypothetical protein [Eubacteriaceae bacterium]
MYNNTNFDENVNIKKRVKDNVDEAVVNWQKKPDCKVKYGDPVISYVSVDHPLFMAGRNKTISKHPKEIFTPGNTVVLVYIPYSKETAESNKGGSEPSQMWLDSFYDSMHLAMHLNKVMRNTFDKLGRIHSPTNSPTDWNEETHREEWSHKLAAYAAGMGRFGIGGSFRTEMGSSGRFTSIIVDKKYAPLDEEEISGIDTDKALEQMWTDCKFDSGSNVEVSEKAIAACPGHAIDKNGIDQEKCQAYCKTINEYIPTPEVCGKCFCWNEE